MEERVVGFDERCGVVRGGVFGGYGMGWDGLGGCVVFGCVDCGDIYILTMVWVKWDGNGGERTSALGIMV